MFKQPLRLINPSSLNAFTVFRQEAFCTASPESAKKYKWDLISAVCLERHPVITKPMKDLEKKVHECFYEMEVERSYKSSHELRVEKDKQTKVLTTDDTEKNIQQTAQDFEDAAQEEFEAFKFSSRVTEADEKKITDSLHRKLDQTLLFLVEKKEENRLVWVPPQGIRNDGETMKQTAERVLLSTCGSDLKVNFYGNAPIGYYKYLYPRAVRKESDGAKVFFFLAKYQKGKISENLKHQWLNRTELSATLDKKLRKGLFQFLIPE